MRCFQTLRCQIIEFLDFLRLESKLKEINIRNIRFDLITEIIRRAEHAVTDKSIDKKWCGCEYSRYKWMDCAPSRC